MGLDMYLKAKKYVSQYTDKETYEKINGIDVGQSGMEINEVSAQAMYWRKANAIHDWFVQNCQDGIDECQETWVGVEKLSALRDLCREVLANKGRACELLPTTSGFFFGSTDYDDWYFQDVQNTETRLTEILENENLIKNWDFYYQSSW